MYEGAYIVPETTTENTENLEFIPSELYPKPYTLGEFIKSPIIENCLLKPTYGFIIFESKESSSLDDILKIVSKEDIEHNEALQNYVILSIEPASKYLLDMDTILIFAKNNNI